MIFQVRTPILPRPLWLAPYRKARSINESVGVVVYQDSLHRSLSSGCYWRSIMVKAVKRNYKKGFAQEVL